VGVEQVDLEQELGYLLLAQQAILLLLEQVEQVLMLSAVLVQQGLILYFHQSHQAEAVAEEDQK
tara:strand:- start:444 stop:635 length:192 start_codon:yes stop_codon:yes gene_type:complete